MTKTIPEKNRQEWRKIILGELEHKYKNYVLQTKIHQLRKNVNYEDITVDDAVSQLHELCSKYAAAVQSDLKQIFKSW